MHWTGDISDEGAWTWLTNPASKASAHYVIGRTGTVWQLVPTDKEAWHAGGPGRSSWQGKDNCNKFSIGIEMVCTGEVLPSGANFKSVSYGKQVLKTDAVQCESKFYQRYTELQLSAVRELVLFLIEKFPSIKEIVGHKDVSPGRKTDPGPHFPMAQIRSLLEGRQ
jgi:N-acetylmuramoyl-L-alanine amidase